RRCHQGFEGGEVAAGAKNAPGAAQYEDAAAFVLLDTRKLDVESAEHRFVESVAARRIVERDEEHARRRNRMQAHGRGSVPMCLQMIRSITSSAPPPIEARRPSRYARESGLSHVKPMPPQYCRQASGTSRESRPALSFAIDASSVTSSPATKRSTAR